MKKTFLQRRVEQVERALEDHLQLIAQEELNRLWRGTQLKIRRINTFRPKVRHSRHKLRKAAVVGFGLWDIFFGRLRTRLKAALMSGAISIHTLLTAQISDKPLELNSEQLARNVEQEVGQRITHVTSTLKREVGRRIVAWYNSPGTSMQTIIDQLQPVFGITRAELIARNEITSLDSMVQGQIASSLGIETWWWMTKRDQIVCKKRIPGPDNKRYDGCRDLHGKIFRIGQPMPPNGSHIGCRCKAVLISETPKKVLPRPIVDTSHLVMKWEEGEHPRNKGGEFTSKGGEGQGGAAPKVHATRADTSSDYHPEVKRFRSVDYGEAAKLMEVFFDKIGFDKDFVTMDRLKVARDPDTAGKDAYKELTDYTDREVTYHGADAVKEYERMKATAASKDWRHLTAWKKKSGLVEPKVTIPDFDEKDWERDNSYPTRFYTLSFGDKGGKAFLREKMDKWEITYVTDSMDSSASDWTKLPGTDEDTVSDDAKQRAREYLKNAFTELAKPKKPEKAPEPEEIGVVIDWGEEGSAGKSAMVDDRVAEVVKSGGEWTTFTHVKGSPDEESKTFANEVDATEHAEKYLANGRKITTRVRQPKVVTPDTKRISSLKKPMYIPKTMLSDCRDKVVDRIQRLARREGKSEDEVTKRILENWHKLVDGEPIKCRASLNDVEAILNDKDGEERYKTQYETKRSHGWIGYGGDMHSARRKAERTGLGYPAGAPDRERPASGYMIEELSSPYCYGEISFVLNKSVRARTTFTLGDSLGLFDEQAGVLVDDPDPLPAFTSYYEELYKGIKKVKGDTYGSSALGSYVETQVQGGWHMGEVDEVEFHKECFDHHTGELLSKYQKLEKEFKERGMKVTYAKAKL